ncbi:hypothetical protein HX52_25415 [Salmonella enterica]|nr:hypothetical protein [Salmonella enterica]EDL3530378.1 hypothetical protein [Salmonella enterica subsp. enterica serovar Newport]EDU6134599.1 hypothetical protein [Salmonella enterica subsp. enterica]EBA1892406.1 hypothetical protein [Salmonella enterica]ECL5469446.1 hypothetical protein [Salmonella enterica]
MRKLSHEEMNSVAGAGVGVGEALDTVIEAILEAAHAGESGTALAEALVHEHEKNNHSGITHDKAILNVDMISANMDMHNILFHKGNAEGLQKDLNTLTSDQRVHYDVQHAGYLAGPGELFHQDIKISHNADVINIDTYSANMDLHDIQSHHASSSEQTDINQLVHDQRTHYDVASEKFVAGPGERYK